MNKKKERKKERVLESCR